MIPYWANFFFFFFWSSTLRRFSVINKSCKKQWKYNKNGILEDIMKLFNRKCFVIFKIKVFGLFKLVMFKNRYLHITKYYKGTLLIAEKNESKLAVRWTEIKNSQCKQLHPPFTVSLFGCTVWQTYFSVTSMLCFPGLCFTITSIFF